jgi:hypothetical protein
LPRGFRVFSKTRPDAASLTTARRDQIKAGQRAQLAFVLSDVRLSRLPVAAQPSRLALFVQALQASERGRIGLKPRFNVLGQ